jgi:succinate dehydrogenase / fumarate reductase iron-sulfur subunit
MEKRKVRFEIYRYDPSKDTHPRYESYEVTVSKGMTVLEVLQFIKDNYAPDLSFRAYCRSAICGSCAVKINGYPKLACKTQVLREVEIYQTDTLRIEPLDNMKVIKDLIVDWDEPFEKLEKVKPYLVPNPEVVPDTLDKESRISPEQHKKYDRFTDCIMCTACYSACTAATYDENYAGPFQLARLYRFAVDPRDGIQEERARIGFLYDMWNCVRCEKCADICPKHVSPVSGVLGLRGIAVNSGDNTPGSRHVRAFYKSLLESGNLNEMLLPLRTKGIKGVLENLPLGIKLLLKGKVHSPVPKKIKDHDTLLKVMREVMEEENG